MSISRPRLGRRPSATPPIAVLALLAACAPSVGRAADDVEPVLRSLVRQISDSPRRISSALSKYVSVERRELFDEASRHRLHQALVDAIREVKDGDAIERAAKSALGKAPSTNLPAQVVVLKALRGSKAELSREVRIGFFLDAVKSRDFRLSTWGIRSLGDSRWPESVDALIELVRERETDDEDLVWHLARGELFRLLGSAASGQSAAAIEAEWKKLGHKVPDEPHHGPPKVGEGEDDVRTVVFFGERVSPRSIFAIDISSSMKQLASIAGGASEPKIEVVKRELARVVSSLQAGFEFNIIIYDAEPAVWRTKSDRVALVEASPGNLDAARGYALGLECGSGTNIFGTLETAIETPELDAIYLLSDGEPSRGGTTAQILEMLERKNYLRGVRVIAYGIAPESGGGFDEEFLKKLSKDNWGWYRKLNTAR